MINRSILYGLALFLMVNTILPAQIAGPRLSPGARISLLTCSPGDELYSVFGHSAIRVSDQMLGFDMVFNYGTFDFSDPNFYTNFVRGRLNYILSVADYRHFEADYRSEGRYIWEQELNIDYRERQFLFDSLLINARPENRYYLYDFFFDNCATRIRDIFTEGIDREIVFDYEVLDTGKSFRELLMPYLAEKPWARLGINLALGLPSDRIATPWDYMFLPDHMMTLYEHAQFEDGSGNARFTPGSWLILEGSDLPKAWSRHEPFLVFLLLLFLTVIMSMRDIRKNRVSWWFDRILFGATGLLGLLIAFLWFGTDHQVTVWNLNILWAHPFHLAALFIMSSEKLKKLSGRYFAVILSMLLLVLILWPLLPQPLPWMIIPVVIAIAVRSAIIVRHCLPDFYTMTASWTGIRKLSETGKSG